MFIARSAFWLSAAFIVMAPAAGVDMEAAARSSGEQLASQSIQAVSSVLSPDHCPLAECAIGRLMVTNTFAAPPKPVLPIPSADDMKTASTAFPPPRPDWAY